MRAPEPSADSNEVNNGFKGSPSAKGACPTVYGHKVYYRIYFRERSPLPGEKSVARRALLDSGQPNRNRMIFLRIIAFFLTLIYA